LIEHGLTSPPTQYRLYGRRLLHRTARSGAMTSPLRVGTWK